MTGSRAWTKLSPGSCSPGDICQHGGLTARWWDDLRAGGCMVADSYGPKIPDLSNEADRCSCSKNLVTRVNSNAMSFTFFSRSGFQISTSVFITSNAINRSSPHRTTTSICYRMVSQCAVKWLWSSSHRASTWRSTSSQRPLIFSVSRTSIICNSTSTLHVVVSDVSMAIDRG